MIYFNHKTTKFNIKTGESTKRVLKKVRFYNQKLTVVAPT